MELNQFQKQIEDIYFEKDSKRGIDGTFRWFVEEVGELAKALRGSDRENLKEEIGDVLAWLATIASIEGIDLEDAARQYAAGCPKCGKTPCAC